MILQDSTAVLQKEFGFSCQPEYWSCVARKRSSIRPAEVAIPALALYCQGLRSRLGNQRFDVKSVLPDNQTGCLLRAFEDYSGVTNKKFLTWTSKLCATMTKKPLAGAPRVILIHTCEVWVKGLQDKRERKNRACGSSPGCHSLGGRLRGFCGGRAPGQPSPELGVLL